MFRREKIREGWTDGGGNNLPEHLPKARRFHALPHLIPATTSVYRRGGRPRESNNFHEIARQLSSRRRFQTQVCHVHETHAPLTVPHCFSVSRDAYLTFQKWEEGGKVHARGSLGVSDPLCHVGRGMNRRGDQARRLHEAKLQVSWGLIESKTPSTVTCPTILCY